jgi:hypothetical protein
MLYSSTPPTSRRKTGGGVLFARPDDRHLPSHSIKALLYLPFLMRPVLSRNRVGLHGRSLPTIPLMGALTVSRLPILISNIRFTTHFLLLSSSVSNLDLFIPLNNTHAAM